jgi:hypothetical protein
MARSIESRRSLVLKGRGADVWLKRAIKSAVREEREAPRRAEPPVDPDAIPIRVLDEGEFVHYPASPDDLRAVMRALPPGTLDGLASVDLSLGASDQPRPGSIKGLEGDPFTGRPGREHPSGIFSGDHLAGYKRGRIGVYAFVYDRTHPSRTVWEVALRADMLESLVHEVAHHDDRTRRFARGRWIMARKVVNERYARRLENEWADQYVLPYVREQYPEEVDALRGWLTEQGRQGNTALCAGKCWLCALVVRLIADCLTVSSG